jgi:hypothetical protein
MEFLHERGLQCFSGLQVPPGVDWETFMLRLTGENGKREKPKVLIIILTAALYQSKPCLKEIDTAIKHEVELLPVRFEDKLPGKAAQWTNLKGQEWEMRKFRVQEKLSALNNIPNPGTVLNRATSLQDIVAAIEKHLPAPASPASEAEARAKREEKARLEAEAKRRMREAEAVAAEARAKREEEEAAEVKRRLREAEAKIRLAKEVKEAEAKRLRELLEAEKEVIPESHEEELRNPMVMEREGKGGIAPASEPTPRTEAAGRPNRFRGTRLSPTNFAAQARDPRGGNEYWDYFCAAFLATLCHSLCDFLCGCCRQFRYRMQVEQAIRKNQAAPKKVEQAITELRRQGWDDDAPSFYFIHADWVRACDTESLPRMQTLRKDGVLKKIKIPLASAFREPAFCGGGIMASILFVSHRWEAPDQPDADGEQLKAIKTYLEAHKDIKWVWFDYSTMPMKSIDGIDDRTPMEKAEFQLMLSALSVLYLTVRNLILLDGSYASRFWTLTEAWCSMQTATPEGLRPAAEAERRYTISCIHTATVEHDGKGLVEKVSTKTPEEMVNVLRSPDVNVTNAKDKETMLPVIQRTNEHVIDMFRKLVKLSEPIPAVAHVKRYAIGSCVFLKRSNGEETLAYVNAYDAEEALYTVEIETLGSGQTEKCHDRDLRAAGVLEG